MGGKKKTKWRKVPLAEFTKDYQSEEAKVLPEEVYQPEILKEGNETSYAAVLDESTGNNAQNFTEPYECIDGVWYSTCFVYNPAEVALYPNYMMPIDNCYYYYTVPDVSSMQEYVPVTYQECIPNVPKADTVYLVLPPPNLRPPQAASNIVPEWQNRRRRRRCEGYAEYANIPERVSSVKFEDKDQSKRSGTYLNPRKGANQVSSHFKNSEFTSEMNHVDKNSSISYKTERNPKDLKRKDVELGGLADKKSNLNKEMEKEDQSKKGARNLEQCGVHRKIAPEMMKVEKELVNASQKLNSNSKGSVNEFPSKSLNDNNKKPNSEVASSAATISTITNSTILPKVPNQELDTGATTTKTLTSNIQDCNNHCEIVLNNEAKDKPIHSNDKNSVNDGIKPKNMNNTNSVNSSSTLPDILSTLNKPLNILDSNNLSKNHLSENEEKEKSKNVISEAVSNLNQLCNAASSEVLNDEMEIELKQLNKLQSLHANKSIYKLAYDENITDQSNSGSPSPLDPELAIPSSIISNEIIVHEADSGSEAGSEDVELLPHRYESESFLNASKHVFVNKLSLAAELLRTQEDLPYDKEFKRVVVENDLTDNLVPVHTAEEESNSPSKDKKYPFNIGLKNQPKRSKVSALFSSPSGVNLGTELCEPAKGMTEAENAQDNTEDVRAGYKRFGIQAQQIFPSQGIPLKSCPCCIIM